LGERGLFRGHGLQAIDGKGRVAIPAPLRAVIERNSGERILLISRHDTDPCLIGYDRGWSELLHARLARNEERALDKDQAFDRHNTARRAFGLVEDVPFDASGRFILPPFFRSKGQLDDLAFFYATGDNFEIWNPKVLIETPGIDEETKEIVAFHLSARGAS
jgi:MraZ protein